VNKQTISKNNKLTIMRTTKRFLMTLAAMIGMTGAWAQSADPTVSPVVGQTNFCEKNGQPPSDYPLNY
jgi:hypothetical protein